MEDATDLHVTACWQLRYAAFLCAIFDELITILREGVSQPSEFAERFGTPEIKSSFLAKIIDRSIVSFPSPAKSWSTFFPQGLR